MAKHLSDAGRFTALGRIENYILPAITALVDVGIVCYPHEGLNNIYCAPNKIFEYAQAGLPVVSTDHPPLKKLVETYKIGRLVAENNSSAEIADIINKVIANRHNYNKVLEKFIYENRFEVEAKQLREHFEKILKY